MIKFRVWNGKRMWYPDSKTDDDSDVMLTFYNGGIKWGLYDYRNEQRVASGEHHQLMLFTGQKDKKKKEIFEGDIVSDGTHKAVVKFGEFEYAFDSECPVELFVGFYFSNGMRFPQPWFLVIGNIYENPQLLK